MFIEGNFTEALQQKKQLDAQYGKNYWTPQLLYIEAVFHVKQRQDSLATLVLKDIIALYPKSPLKDKAQNMIDVLKRRSEIEAYLTALQVTRAADDAPIKVADDPVKVVPPPVQPTVPQPTTTTPPPDPQLNAPVNNQAAPTQAPSKSDPGIKPLVTATGIKIDTSKKLLPALVYKSFTMALNDPHYMVMLLDKLDPVYVNEARNALNRYHREIGNGQPIEIKKDTLSANQNLLVFVQFANAEEAFDYYEKVKRAAPVEVSWLPANKYSFFIITEPNLQLLKTNKDMIGYTKLLNMQYPGKF
jgi:hypothetical protein